METMASIELDWYHEGHATTTSEACSKHDLKARLIKEYGPAGGNPVYRFVGDRHSILKMLNEQATSWNELEHMEALIKD